MTRRTPAHVARAAARVALTKILNAARVNHDEVLEQKDIAEAVGAKPQKVSLWCDVKSPNLPSIADLTLLPEPMRTRVLVALAEKCGFTLVARVDVDRRECAMRSLSRILKEGGDVTTALSSALEDGHIDPAEAREIAKQAAEAEREFAALRLAMEDIAP